MAQLVLSAASSLAPAGAGLGAIVGRTLAATAASYAAGAAERLIFGPRKRRVAGARLEALRLQSSTEGAGVLRVYGRARVAGQLIWAARFKETVAETTEAGKGGRLGTKATTTEYLYSLSFAVGLCEGPIARIARVWADGKPFDLSPHNVRIHQGTEDQLPDALLEAAEGSAPAYRGLAYIVFEDLPLKDFGNRIPQFSFEIERPLLEEDPEALENAVTALTMIPGSGEFVYGTTKVARAEREGVSVPENVHSNDGVADFSASLSAATATFPNLQSVSLIVSWFGTATDAASCEIRPGVEAAAKTTTPYEWRAGGVAREGARLVTQIDGAAAYGGTPADRAVREAIAALKAAGLQVMLHPFILMDAAGFPWRGRIGVSAADKTPAAADALANFFGAAAPADFAVIDGEIVYAGPDEWSFRRFVLHLAHLCAEAGGVDAFLLGSELVGVTTARAGPAAYPAVAMLSALAADVRTILGPATRLSYGADWTEWRGHQPPDGSGDVFFHLDPFWADPEIDMIAVDMYAPRADWRDGDGHLDALAGFAGPRERAYLAANIEGGEGFDWYYASTEDRDAQIRQPIADGAYGEPWIYRVKDVRQWWANPHHDRPGGVRAPTPTAWTPEMKPILFSEFGVAAVDKGANQPNLFVDPKSVESGLPYYSSGARDDLAQRRLIEAELAHWRLPANNPVSSVYGAPMIEAERLHLYAWDARPYPFFPARTDVWGDAANYERGHWLNGRAGRAPLDLLVAALCEGTGAEVDTRALEGAVAGYLLDRPLSPREAIDPLADIFAFEMKESADALIFFPRAAAPVATLPVGALVAREEGAVSVSLADEALLPAALRLGFLDEENDGAAAITEARDPAGAGRRETALEAPVILSRAEAGARARALLADAGPLRETARFTLPPSLLALEPGDVVRIEEESLARNWRVAEIADGAGGPAERRVEAVRAASSAYGAPALGLGFAQTPAPIVYGAPLWEMLDLPLMGAEREGAALFAAFARPWPGAVGLWRGPGPLLAAVAREPSVFGRLAEPLPPAKGSGRFAHHALRLALSAGALVSRSEEEVLAGANALAVETAEGFEVLQFQTAALGEDGVWTLSPLLRGQAGSERQAAAGAGAGARAVLIGPALAEVALSLDWRGVPLAFEAGPDGEQPGSANFTAKEIALAFRALLPLSPVHLKAAREAAGLRLSWIRRTRLGGDAFAGEVPLAEAFERYAVRILDGETILRTLAIAGPFAADATPNILYTNDMIAEDFGAGGIEVAVAPAFEVAQLSDLVGEGERARAGF